MCTQSVLERFIKLISSLLLLFLLSFLILYFDGYNKLGWLYDADLRLVHEEDYTLHFLFLSKAGLLLMLLYELIFLGAVILVFCIRKKKHTLKTGWLLKVEIAFLLLLCIARGLIWLVFSRYFDSLIIRELLTYCLIFGVPLIAFVLPFLF